MQTISIEIQNLLIRQILEISDINILSEIQEFLRKKQISTYKLTFAQLSLLAKSEQELDEGKLIDNEDVFNEIDEWLNKN